MRTGVRILTGAALFSAAVAVGLSLAPGPLYATGWVGLKPAFASLLDWSPWASIGAIGFGLIAAGAALRQRTWSGVIAGLIACTVGAAVWLTVADFKRTASASPIHDVTTNLEAPPNFKTLTPRAYAPDAKDAVAGYPHPEWRSAHQRLYEDIQTVVLNVTSEVAVRRATEVLRRIGAQIAATETSGGLTRIEAVHKTGWFGFEDDIVIVIGARAEGNAMVDIRSVSRIGVGDIGKNAARIREIIKQMNAS